MHRPSRLHLAIVVSCLAVVAGCGGIVDDPSQTGEGPQTTTSATAADETTSTATTATASDTTTTVSYTEGIEDDLRISNFRNQSQTVAVNVTDGNGTAVFELSVTVATDGNATFDFSYPGGGTYVVTAVVGDESASQTYGVQSSDPGSEIGIVLLDDGIRIDEVAV